MYVIVAINDDIEDGTYEIEVTYNEDDIFNTSTRRKTINSNQEYLEEFALNFDKLTTSNSIFNIKVFGIDYTKGFLDIEVESHFKILNGKTKIISSRKTSIVDILL